MSTIKSKLSNTFGNKSFVKEYWRLILPVIGFGLLFALGPIILATTFDSLIPKNAHAVKDIFGYGNYLVQLYWYFGIAFVFGATSVIGNYIRKGNIKDIHSILRVTFYNLMIINIVFFTLLEVLAPYFIEGFLHVTSNDPNFGLYLLDIRILALNVFLYPIIYLFIICIAPFRMIKNNLIAAFWTFLFYIVVAVIFLAIAGKYNLSTTQIIISLAIIYVLSLFVFMFYFIILSQRKYITWFKVNKINNVLPYDNYSLIFTNQTLSQRTIWKTNAFEILLIPNPAIVLKFFTTGWGFDWHKFKELWSLGWVVCLDESLWVLANFIFEILSVSVKGTPGSGWNEYNSFIIVNTLISASVYAILDGWIILPQHFVATELGKGNRKQAKKYGDQLINWSVIIGLMLVVIYVIVGISLSFTNAQSVTLNNGNILSRTTVALNMFAFVIIFSFSTVLINSIYQTIASLLTVGGSKWIQFCNSFITIINSFAVIVPLSIAITNGNSILNAGNIGDFYGYYAITRVYVFIKLAIAWVLWKTNHGLNSINTLKMNKNKQKIKPYNLKLNRYEINNILNLSSNHKF